MCAAKSRGKQRRGGTLTDADHHLLALWAASCAEHVLPLFRSVRPDDPRPQQAIEQIRELVLDDQRQRNDICWSVFG